MAANLPPLGPNSHSVNTQPLNSDASQRTSLCQTIINFPGNLARMVFSRLALPNSSTENPPLQNLSGFAFFNTFPDALTEHTLSFLEDQDLRVLNSVSHLFRPSIDSVCPDRCQNKKFIPESLPPGVNYRQFLLNRFPNAIGVDFFEKYFGEVDIVPPIPRNFIAIVPRPGLKLVLIPEYLTITVHANSRLMLDETTAVDGKKARLIEDPERAPQGQTRKIKVPITPNNYVMLTQTYFKQHPFKYFRFDGISGFSCLDVLRQNVDIGVGPSHWSYQEKKVIGLNKPYHSQPNGEKGQVEMANDEGLEIVPLGDRIVFHLSSHIKSGKTPQSNPHFERTSTVVHSNNGQLWQASMYWSVYGPAFCLNLSRYHGHSSIGAAVRVPAGSSQTIGH